MSWTYIFAIQLPICITDIAPIAYVIYCHHKTFELMAQISIGMQNSINQKGMDTTMTRTQDKSVLAGTQTTESIQPTLIAPAPSEQ